LNVNTASRADLVALKGIGPSRADAIMNGRPYGRLSELTDRRILPGSLFASLEDRLRVE
jgi:competence protein ComEA